MFEGLVHRVLVGYLGRYVRNFQKDQLKLSLWNEEVLLENVELIPEAFDYLQLPFAIKQGRVGRLSIKISWKKLGWDHPIIIVLEDVFICASERDDHEWSMEAVETREYAGKKAKLAAAELAKLSRRVCDNQAGKSFISYITAKVLDSIQMSVRNFHVQYSEMQPNSVYFGLKFTALMIKQSLIGSSGGKTAGGQVNKTVDIEGLEIYSMISEGVAESNSLNDATHSASWSSERSEGTMLDHLLHPFDVTISLVVNRSGKPDNDMAQYSIGAEVTGLEISLDEVQLQQILILSDHMCISRLREKYGRYRPWQHSLSRKQNGWQILWWHYAQESILSDVRKKLKKTSWRYLGQRLNSRRKYINLYKIKLDFIQQEQPIDEFVLEELEEMEKESDIDDILNYRSAAEHELQETFPNSLSLNMRENGVSTSLDKSRHDDNSSGRSRGWLNWLSRGMLGAGGTDDSTQFSGVVSDEVVKDIYEATKFHPLFLSSSDVDAIDRMFTCSINLSIGQIAVAFQSKSSSQKIAHLVLNDTVVDCKLWEELAAVMCSIKSGKLVYPCNGRVVLQIGRLLAEGKLPEDKLTSCTIQVDVSQKWEVELSVKVLLQPFEVNYDVEFFLKCMELFTVLNSIEFQQKRVLWSLNGFKDVKTRLLSKAECSLSSRSKLSWDVSILNVIINVPGRDDVSGRSNLVLELGSLLYTSSYHLDAVVNKIPEECNILKQFSSSTSDFFTDFRIQDLYNYFTVKLESLELKLNIPQHATVTVLEKFCASITFASCIISDESILKQLEVYVILPSVAANFSLPIFESMLALVAHLNSLHAASRPLISKKLYPRNVMLNEPWDSAAGFSISAKLMSTSFHVNIAKDRESSCELILFLQESNISYSRTEIEECLISAKALRFATCSSKGENDGCVLFASGNQFGSDTAHHQDLGCGNSSENGNCGDKSLFTEGSFWLHYRGHGSGDFFFHEYSIGLNEVDLHCYPHIFGRLVAFYERLSSYDISSIFDRSFSQVMDKTNPYKRPGFHFRRFGYSNFSETGSADCDSISLDCYPFITITNSGSLSSLENSLCHSIPDWRRSFNLRKNKIGSPTSSLKKKFKPVLAPFVMHSSKMNLSGSLGDADVVAVDITVSGVRVHFHDSSCIVSTVTIPISRSTLLTYEDYMDLLCSTEGVVLTSPWCSRNFKDFLWGPSLAHPSSILNLRVRKVGSMTSPLEVSIGIQHVYCFLPPEYLAIVVGYFSLSDWGSNLMTQQVNGNRDSIIAEKGSSVIYKFEILDSTLILPVEQDPSRFLKIELQQLYCSFILNSSSNDLLKDIPSECMVSMHKLAKANNCLNIYGRDLCLSVLLFKDDEYGCLILNEDTGCRKITLIELPSADVWVRLPCESESCLDSSSVSTCFMSRIASCQLIVDDCYTLHGVEALMDVINQFSSVGTESAYFTSDVLQFFQLKRSLKENGGVQPTASSMISTEARCCANALSIILYQSRDDSVTSKQIAKAEMQLICSASLINETPIDLDLSFSTLALHSLLNSVMIAQCSNAHPASVALHVSFSKSTKGENEFHLSLPSLNLWLHVLDWSAIIDIYNSYSKRMAGTVEIESSSKSLSKDMDDHAESAAHNVPHSTLLINSSSNYSKEQLDRDSFVLSVRSENIGVTVHFPIWDAQSTLSELGIAGVQGQEPRFVSSHANEENTYKYMAVTVHSRNTELSMVDRNVKLKSILDKTSSTLRKCEGNSITTWPFFQISQVIVMIEIFSSHINPVDAKLEVQVDRLDAWLSHQVFCFWYGVQFDIPGSSTSQSSFGSMDFKVHLRKVSLLISDERWSCGGPLLEIITKNCMFHFIIADSSVEMSVASDLEVNYNNIHKVLWEPFVELWRFQINMIRRQKKSALLNNSIVTDIHLSSTAPLNLNCTESFIECVFRTAEMVNDAWHLAETTLPSESQRFSIPQCTETTSGGSYAPYILQNLTSLPLVYHVFQGLVDVDEFDASEMEEGKAVEPGASIPIYLIETPEKQLVHFRSAQSSDRLSEKQSIGSHHFMSIQLEGMSLSSAPISIDRVGVTCFEVDFSKASNKTEVEKNWGISKYNLSTEENTRSDTSTGFTVPVVFDVSVQRYSKLLRLYSTVILLNSTSIPLELRFDIPFGISPKILDPIYPGQEFPLPLHLAESGRLRWRPLGNSFLWSEVHDLSNILSQEMKIGFFRSFVCYPTHPSSDPFRCCISVQNFSVPSAGKSNKGLLLGANITKKQSVEISTHDWKQSKNKFIHQVTLSTPLVLYNYLPDAVSLTIECGGVARSSLFSEGETSFHHVDPSHDLVLEFHIQGFKPSHLKFLRAETFSSMAKFNGSKFSLIETMIFDPELSNGPLYVTVEKMMDAFSGSREIFISVTFLIYNCTGLPLNILESAAELNRNPRTVPSCYGIDNGLLEDKKSGLGILSSDQDSYATTSQYHDLGSSSEANRIVFSKRKLDLHFDKPMHNPVVLSGSSESLYRQSNKLDSVGNKASSFTCFSSEPTSRDSDLADTERRKVRACMYSPCGISSVAEFMVRIKRCLPDHVVEEEPHSSWSEPFLLAPPSGSTTVRVPQSSPNASFVLSVTSNALGGPLASRTQAITFQPKYVISNACSRALCYKQKGTEIYVHLCIGQHSHLHCTDNKRDLLVSVRFNEPGWQWSGSFLPDYLGDTQVKMRNYISGELHMIRVEVQNADVSIRDEKIVGNLQGNSGTNLILLSDDDTGFMPYRIDNFSKERLRIYQQRCETFDTIIQPYTSCPYAWDEPCYPHRLIVEVPGERVVGLYALDDPREYVPVHLKSTSEKPERTLLLSTHAEGATKVLSIVDSANHILKDPKESIPSWFQPKRKYEQKPENFVDYEEKFSLSISCIGLSLINAYPEELLFAYAKDITLTLLQSLDQQKLSFQISSLQIDNQLRTTPYPVILSFNPEYRSSVAGQRTIDGIASMKSESVLQISSESCHEPVFDLAIATWRKGDMSLVSFEYISLRVADFRLELEQELILSLLDLSSSVYARFENSMLLNSNPSSCPLIYDMGLMHSQIYGNVKTRENELHGNDVLTHSRSQIRSPSIPSVFPIGAPWQQIHFLAKRQKKIYVELFDLAPIQFTLSFSSAPWMVGNGFRTRESIIHSGIMAFADVEGARIHLKQLTIAHQMASWESMQDIIFRHYTRQLLHEMYKVFGSAGVIGNPMGFARSLGLGIRDFLSVPARSILQSPTGIITGMAQGTTSLLSNTVYALSDAATQFSKAAHKGIVAFTFDDQSRMEKQHKGVVLHTKGVINEVLEGLTGLLQSPIKEAEKHGLPGVLSGIAMGITGLVARPAASILEVTGKTAQSIRNRSRLYQIGSQRYRMRLPRPLSRELPLRPYSLEEAVGTSILMEVDDGVRLKDEVFVMCKSLKQDGKFAVVTERLVMIVSCPSLVDLMKPGFRGVPADPEWLVESEICLDSVIHVDAAESVVHIVGSSSDALPRQNQQQSRKVGGVTRTKHWNSTSTRLPLFQTNLELASDKDADDLLQMLLSLIEQGKGRGWGSVHLLHKGNMIWKQGNSCLSLSHNPL